MTKTRIRKISNLILGLIILFSSLIWPGMGHITNADEPLSEDQVSHSQTSFPFQNGFPQSVSFDGVGPSSPAVADVNNDGDYEIFVGDSNGIVYGWDNQGNLLPGFPITTEDSTIPAPVVLADIAGDSNLEIIAGTSSLGATGSGKDRARVFAWYHNGIPVKGWPQSVPWDDSLAPDWAWNEVTSVAVADIDGDRDYEVLATSTNRTSKDTSSDPKDALNAFAWHHDGSTVDGWPTATGEWPTYDNRVGIYGQLAVGNFAGNGVANPVIPRDYYILHVYDGAGQVLDGWPIIPFYDPDTTWGSDTVELGVTAPVLADLDQDGKKEIIFNGMRQTASFERLSSALMVYRRDGSRYPGWEFPASGIDWLSNQVCAPYDMVSIANLDDDPHLEIVSSTNDGYIRAYNLDKTLLWEFDYTLNKDVISGEAVIGDVDGDGAVEVVFGTYQPDYDTTDAARIWALERDGTVVSGFPLEVSEIGVCSAPALADLDSDGDVELIVATPDNRDQIIVWDLPAAYNADLMPWPQGRHDAQRTGSYEDTATDITESLHWSTPAAADVKEIPQFHLTLQNSGVVITDMVTVTIQIPTPLTNVRNVTVEPLTGTTNLYLAGQTLTWVGVPNQSPLNLRYDVTVGITETLAMTSIATIEYPTKTFLIRKSVFIANPERLYLPMVLKN